MRLEIRSAYGESKTIDTRDLDMMAKWIVQTLLDIQPTPDAPAMVQSWPRWTPDETGRGQADWIADSRVLGYMQKVRTPREVVAYLADQVAAQEKLASESASGLCPGACR
jgi:hypothetical protein